MPVSTLRAVLVRAAVVVALASGCSPAVGEPAPQAGYGEADVRFSQEMIPHHRQTIALAKLAADRTRNTYVRELGESLAEGEQADIDVMASWLRAWGRAVPEDHGSAHAMPGMLAPEQVAELERSSGQGFDRKWLSVIVDHLEAGVQMAETVQAEGSHAETAELAEEIAATQRARIEEIVGRTAPV
ncbi:DUF305 domain-containing protein [Nonomuraea sp. SBT364]|uniref:DUF305 domain-containing protein n=1 Tax=Nonomuraea sp. SBT364 TaxID=1580530 RepID=UPI00066C9F11|nr:DUF305 domain-containing protein [Nonomuraea sp. SBT364]